LNVDTSAGGTVKVEVLDESGAPLPGFSESDADALNTNSVRAICTWNGNADVGGLAGRVVKLRFVMRDTKLYSLQFVPPSGG
jgi:hypothetical protein